MPYIDEDYYLKDYIGKDPNNVLDLKQAIMRASDEVDRLTGYKLLNVDMDSQPTIITDQVKKATAQMAEHYIIHGGYEAIRKQDLTSVSIGKFNYSKAGRSGADSINDIPDQVYDTLSITGLLYRGINS